MCRIYELTKAAQEELLRATRLGEKMTLARLNFTDAANDDDAERMQRHREEVHTIVDSLLDATWSTAKINKDLKDVLSQGGVGGRPH